MHSLVKDDSATLFLDTMKTTLMAKDSCWGTHKRRRRLLPPPHVHEKLLLRQHNQASTDAPPKTRRTVVLCLEWIKSLEGSSFLIGGTANGSLLAWKYEEENIAEEAQKKTPSPFRHLQLSGQVKSLVVSDSTGKLLLFVTTTGDGLVQVDVTKWLLDEDGDDNREHQSLTSMLHPACAHKMQYVSSSTEEPNMFFSILTSNAEEVVLAYDLQAMKISHQVSLVPPRSKQQYAVGQKNPMSEFRVVPAAGKSASSLLLAGSAGDCLCIYDARGSTHKHVDSINVTGAVYEAHKKKHPYSTTPAAAPAAPIINKPFFTFGATPAAAPAVQRPSAAVGPPKHSSITCISTPDEDSSSFWMIAGGWHANQVQQGGYLSTWHADTRSMIASRRIPGRIAQWHTVSNLAVSVSNQATISYWDSPWTLEPPVYTVQGRNPRYHCVASTELAGRSLLAAGGVGSVVDIVEDQCLVETLQVIE